jgi:hypothetical protein
MGDARRTDAREPSPLRRLASVVVLPTHMSVEPDADSFRQVQSRRRWRRVDAPRSLVPSILEGKCFNCLATDHVRADYTFPSRCFNCEQAGHQAWDCPMPPVCGRNKGKCGRSPARTSGQCRSAPRRRSSPSRDPSARDTVSARFASTGREPSVSPVCDPLTPEPNSAPMIMRWQQGHRRVSCFMVARWSIVMTLMGTRALVTIVHQCCQSNPVATLDPCYGEWRNHRHLLGHVLGCRSWSSLSCHGLLLKRLRRHCLSPCLPLSWVPGRRFLRR